jgi:predicted outer membrane repeat protein
VAVAVTTPGGTGNKASAYTYVAAPMITDVAPAEGPSSGGTLVTITGTNFASATGVSFGGSAATFTVDSATRITATAPAHAAGAVAVTVSSPGGDGNLPGAYTYVAAPTVTGIAPDRGPVVGGTEVEITGTGFAGASVVKFGTTPAMSFTVDSATQITAFAPAHAAGVVDVVVTTVGGASATTGADHYTYVDPRRCHVRADATGANDGSSWADAYTDLQSALAEAGCAEVWVARGVYRPVVPVDAGNVTAAERAAAFRQRPLTALYGGFAGSEDMLDQRDPSAQPTVLSGDLAGDDTGAIDGVDPLVPTDASADENSLHVLVMGGAGLPIDAATVLDGFIITGGHADGSGADGNGGGLACDGRGAGNACSPTLARVVFSGNHAALDGGALHADGSNGGDASPVLDQALFRGNRAGCGGGASFANSAGTSNPVIAHSTFAGNTASTAGGALCLRSNAGGSGTPQLGNVTFSGNLAAGDGAGSGNGGAIHGLADSAGTLHLQVRNVTFSGNHAALDGGAIHLSAADGGVAAASLGNAVLWNDSAVGAGAEIALAGGATATLAHGVVDGGCPAGVACSGAFISADPRLGVLADNGGATPTHLPGAGSSAVDAGDDATCEADDQRGLARPQGTHCDLGAVEAGPPSLSLVLDQAGPAWVTYGEVVDYVVRLVNAGEGAATNLAVQATFGGGADIGNTQWQCIPGSIGATCTIAGNGPVDDSVTIPPGVSVTWLIHVPVSTSTPAGTLDFIFGASGIAALHDSSTIVLFRDGFEAGESP